MRVEVPKGKYVLAVSGGVDSMVLLDFLAKKPGIELIVAHFDHGIRPDSAEDLKHTRQAAKRLKCPFEAGWGHLGAHASEEQARNARYGYLYGVKEKHRADSIITAHHQDDLIETAIINLLRGTNYRGLTAISSNKNVIRPLLGVSKRQILEYALDNKLVWREDSTNQDLNYLRNYLRLCVVPRLTPDQKQELLKNIDKVANTTSEIDNSIATLSHIIRQNNQINRELFSSLPAEVANELVVYWLKEGKILDFDRKTVERLNLAIKTSKPNKAQPIKGSSVVKINLSTAQFNYTL